MKTRNFIKKYIILMSAVVLSVGMLTGCGEEAQPAVSTQSSGVSEQPVELTILAAASLTDACGEIEAMYEAANPNVELVFSFGGSGALQTQIAEGAPADIFFPAATGPMMALDEQGLMETDSIRNLLENRMVLVVPSDPALQIAGEITSFADVTTDKVELIGLGEPGSVPAGQYAEEIFAALGTWEEAKAKANYGSDVRTVLAWVETGAVDCGVVYTTDAYSMEAVTIACEAPEGSCTQVIYPAGIVSSSEEKEAAEAFLSYLESDEVMQLFVEYGFSPAE